MARKQAPLEPTALQSATLVDALIVLHELQDEATTVACSDESDPRVLYDLGRFQEATDLARDLLFNVLNTGENMLGSRGFEQAMKHYAQRRQDRRSS